MKNSRLTDEVRVTPPIPIDLINGECAMAYEPPRLKASDFDPEVLGLFDQYVHGLIDRRGFLERAARFAVGGLSAAGLLAALNPRFAEAEQIAKTDPRIRAEFVEIPSPRGYGKANGYLVFKNIDLSGIRALQIAAQAPLREGFKGGTLEVRLGSLTGELVGQATIGNAGAMQDANAAQSAGGAVAPGGTVGVVPATIPLKPMTGSRDIYLVVRNAGAKTDDLVLSIATITFVQ